MNTFSIPGKLGNLSRKSGLLTIAGLLLLLMLVLLANCSLLETPDNRKVLLENPSQPGVEHIVDGIRVPWGIDFLPGGNMLVTDRPTGKLYLVDPKSGSKVEIGGVPVVDTSGQGGLLDVLARVEPGGAV